MALRVAASKLETRRLGIGYLLNVTIEFLPRIDSFRPKE
jgi:hypothetical protein